jgi:hypothetical protein
VKLESYTSQNYKLCHFRRHRPSTQPGVVEAATAAAVMGENHESYFDPIALLAEDAVSFDCEQLLDCILFKLLPLASWQ